jgi:hypothetical protein
MNNFWGLACFMLILGRVQRFSHLISHGNALNFDDPQKTDNHITRREIDEMRELQQVTATVPDAAKRCRFYRVELLNGGNIGRGEKCC